MGLSELELKVVQEAIARRFGEIGQLFDDSPLARAVDALIFACPQCNAGGHACPGDGQGIPHGATDCGEHEEDAEPAWTPATWGVVLAGDRVRLGTQEADVESAVAQTWHADNADPYRPKPWEHTVMRVRLTHLAESLSFPAGDPVEILADAERRAALTLSTAFAGTGHLPSANVD